MWDSSRKWDGTTAGLRTIGAFPRPIRLVRMRRRRTSCWPCTLPLSSLWLWASGQRWKTVLSQRWQESLECHPSLKPSHRDCRSSGSNCSWTYWGHIEPQEELLVKMCGKTQRITRVNLTESGNQSQSQSRRNCTICPCAQICFALVATTRLRSHLCTLFFRHKLSTEKAGQALLCFRSQWYCTSWLEVKCGRPETRWFHPRSYNRFRCI